MSAWWWLVPTVLVGVYAAAVIEEWATTGRISPGGPLRAGLALLGRESLVPRQPDRVLFELAPLVLLIAAVLSLAVLPLAHALSPCWVTRKPPPVSRPILNRSRRFNPAAISS